MLAAAGVVAVTVTVKADAVVTVAVVVLLADSWKETDGLLVPDAEDLFQ